MHYLCRPQALESVPVFDFYTKYEVCNVTRGNKNKILNFHNTRYFKHPSYNSKKKQFQQGVQKNTSPTLAKVFQYDFPDTATFEGELLHPGTHINSYMEQYSKFVLLLFHVYRKKVIYY
jgi:hypothetical protein